ncbi:UvrD-helicase domain-containing protein [Brackiella oedipodis]|uniref:UvrD-helicase domain-containing protein n=1 Tax=Brackiella oedipodis TaxID=124225 RepID=UPI000686EE1A|nr:UvrD-helicase domain-containing protein [Brackiella oedipodis]
MLNQLSAEQYQAVSAVAPSILLMAGAGTGKTRSLVARVIYLITQRQVKPEQILLLAFTQKAALEMQQRLQALAPNVAGIEQVSVRTFHSLGLWISQQGVATKLCLSPLSEEVQFKRFVHRELLWQCRQSPARLSQYYLWATLIAQRSVAYTAQSSSNSSASSAFWRTLNDDYVRHQAELIVANLLYIYNIHYRYRGIDPHPWRVKKYQTYLCSFYLPEECLLIEVVPPASTQAERKQQSLRLAGLQAHYSSQNLIKLKVLYAAKNEYESYKIFEQFIQTLSPSAASQQKAIGSATNPCRLGRSSGLIEHILEELRQGLLIYLSVYPRLSLKRLVGHALAPAAVLMLYMARAYKRALRQQQQTDFNSMIEAAIRAIQCRRFIVPWDHVLIDEFQDISRTRANLIRAMRQQHPALQLFCVGDDWQTIYRFSGSEVRYSTDFEQYFGTCRRFALSQTYRFETAMCQLSSDFVLQNPAQNRKYLRMSPALDIQIPRLRPITLVSESQTVAQILHCITQDIKAYQAPLATQNTQRSFTRKYISHPTSAVYSKAHKQPSYTVFILSRFQHFLPSAKAIEGWQAQYPVLKISAHTVHAVKGNEADYVIVLQMNQGIYGFPSEKQSSGLIESLLPAPEDFLYAEERRLFYVALTRARRQCFLHYHSEHPSRFIQELRQSKAIQKKLPTEVGYHSTINTMIYGAINWLARVLRSIAS